MADPNTDLQSKIARAIRAVLVDQGAGTYLDTYAAPASDEKVIPNTGIIAADAVPFDGPGNWHFPNITLTLKDSAAVQPNESSTGPRVDASARCARIYNALARSNDENTLFFTASELTRLGQALAIDQSGGLDPDAVAFAAANADMADFTVMWWDFVGKGMAQKDDGGTFWERELTFSCVACDTGDFIPKPDAFTVVSGKLIPLMNNTGDINGYKVYDDTAGQWAYWRIVNGREQITSS